MHTCDTCFRKKKRRTKAAGTDTDAGFFFAWLVLVSGTKKKRNHITKIVFSFFFSFGSVGRQTSMKATEAASGVVSGDTTCEPSLMIQWTADDVVRLMHSVGVSGYNVPGFRLSSALVDEEGHPTPFAVHGFVERRNLRFISSLPGHCGVQESKEVSDLWAKSDHLVHETFKGNVLGLVDMIAHAPTDTVWTVQETLDNCRVVPDKGKMDPESIRLLTLRMATDGKETYRVELAKSAVDMLHRSVGAFPGSLPEEVIPTKICLTALEALVARDLGYPRLSQTYLYDCREVFRDRPRDSGRLALGSVADMLQLPGPFPMVASLPLQASVWRLRGKEASKSQGLLCTDLFLVVAPRLPLPRVLTAAEEASEEDRRLSVPVLLLDPRNGCPWFVVHVECAGTETVGVVVESALDAAAADMFMGTHLGPAAKEAGLSVEVEIASAEASTGVVTAATLTFDGSHGRPTGPTGQSRTGRKGGRARGPHSGVLSPPPLPCPPSDHCSFKKVVSAEDQSSLKPATARPEPLVFFCHLQVPTTLKLCEIPWAVCELSKKGLRCIIPEETVQYINGKASPLK
jgi:hypothetical protein